MSTDLDPDTVRIVFCEQLFYADWDEDEAIGATAELLELPSDVVARIVYPEQQS